MKPSFLNFAGRLALALALSTPGMVGAQDPQATPMDEKARERAARDARKAAEREEKALKAAADKERKEAEKAAKDREKTTARIMEMEASSPAAAPSTQATPSEASNQAPPSETLTKEQKRIRDAEEKARAEAEKARKKEEDRVRAQEAKDAERRRKDEERAQREAAKAREKEEKERLKALENARNQRPPDEAPSADLPVAAAPPSDAPPLFSKEDEKNRKELVKQIEKARDERDKLNQKAEEAERIAAAARAGANEAQRGYEALTAGLDIADVSPPPQMPAEGAQPRKSRFVTKADVLESTAEKNAPVAAAPDPLRVALDLKNADPEQREKAAFALASLGPDAQPATRALMAALADANPAVRVAAAQALGRIGPGAAAALAPLSAALTDPDPAVKNAAQAALLAIQAR